MKRALLLLTLVLGALSCTDEPDNAEDYCRISGGYPCDGSGTWQGSRASVATEAQPDAGAPARAALSTAARRTP